MIRYLVWLLLVLGLQSCAIFEGEIISPENKTGLSTQLPIPKYISSPTPIPTNTPLPTPTAAAGVEFGARQIMEGDWDAAKITFQDAYTQSVHPTAQSGALLGLGRAAYLSGDYNHALIHLRKVIDLYPDSPYRAHAWFFLGQTYNTLERYAESAHAYQQYLSLRAGMIDSYVYELRADALAKMNDGQAALAAYQEALKADRAADKTTLEINLAKAYVQTANYETAVVMFDDIRTRSENTYIKAQMLLFKGQSLFALGRKDEAYAAYMDAVENYPQAYDSYSALVELVNANVAVNELSRGIVDYYAGEYNAAFAALDRYISSKQGEVNTLSAAHYFRAMNLQARHDFQAAVKEFDELIQNYPISAYYDKAFEQKGYTQWNYLEQYPAAVKTFLEYTQKHPEEVRAVEFLTFAAQVAERSGDLEQAAKIWERVAVEYPQSAQIFRSTFLAGIVRYRLGQFPQAHTNWQRALGMTVDIEERAAVLFWMGKAQQAIGNPAAAQSNWQQVQLLNSTGYYGARAQQLLSGDEQLARFPFSPPALYNLQDNLPLERSGAELWLKNAFNISSDVDLASLGTLLDDQRLWRGTELWALGLYAEANDEFSSLQIAVEDDAVNLYRLVNYLYNLGAYRTVIFTARRILDLGGVQPAEMLSAPLYYNRLRFGIYFGDLFISAAEKYQLHPLLLLSVARQESMFQVYGHSQAGARGLMQVIPSTGENIAEQLSWPPNYNEEDLFRPNVSVVFGTYYLSKMSEMFDGDLIAALAAYNGGPGNASKWKELAPQDVDLFVECIRYEETRNYIRAVFENFIMYSQLYNKQP